MILQWIQKSLEKIPLPLLCLIGYSALSLVKTLLYISLNYNTFYDFNNGTLIMEALLVYVTLETLRITEKVKLKSYNSGGLKLTIVPTLLSAFNVQLNVSSLDGGWIAMSIKQFCPLAVVVIGRKFMGKYCATSRLTASIVILCFACAVTNCFYSSITLFELMYSVVMMIMQSIVLLLFENLLDKITVLELLYYNAFHSLIVFLLMDISQDELRDSLIYIVLNSNLDFLISYISLLLIAATIQFLALYCLKSIDSITLSVISNCQSTIQVFFVNLLSSSTITKQTLTTVNYVALLISLAATVHIFYKTGHWKIGRLRPV